MSFSLVLDFGNTALKAALFREEQLQAQATLEAPSLKAIAAFTAERAIGRIILASVVKHPQSLERELESIAPLLVLDGSTRLPFRNLYRTPETLGYDRIAAAAGAWQLFRGSPVLAIMAGTCITYNLIDAQENFTGGAIAPGLHMRLRAMHEFTEKLPLVPLEGEHPLTGNTTETSLRAGVHHGTIAETEGMIRRYEEAYPGLKTVIGGGDAAFLADGLKNGIFARPNLVLEGLNCILRYHAGNFSQ